jgi:hypothetical protein
MADEAFALSPISARAALPGEADYEAISAAFMETSRGRWFLNEYARRNRNADTRMVLDAVARIEQNLAAQKDAPDHRLAEALAAVRQSVDQARAAAAQAWQGLATEEMLAPIQGGARAIREILQRLREIGADGRIYDSIESEVSAIEAGCAKLAATDADAALNAAFGLISRQIAALGSGTASSASSDAHAPTAEDQEPAAGATALPSEISVEVTQECETFAVTPPIAAGSAEAQDEAVLDLIALEMAAEFSDHHPDESWRSGADPALPPTAAQPADPALVPQPATAPQPSLGASLIAQGIVRPPNFSAADPMAPIRRMSQAEKIAFFS